MRGGQGAKERSQFEGVRMGRPGGGGLSGCLGLRLEGRRLEHILVSWAGAESALEQIQEKEVSGE